MNSVQSAITFMGYDTGRSTWKLPGDARSTCRPRLCNSVDTKANRSTVPDSNCGDKAEDTGKIILFGYAHLPLNESGEAFLEVRRCAGGFTITGRVMAFLDSFRTGASER